MEKFKNNGKLKLLIIVGTRPEIIRLAAVINKCREYFDCLLAHTVQNYDYKLNGDRGYSSYFEISAPFKLATCDWTATAGAVPFGAQAVYGTEDFAVTNLSLRCTKDIKITDSFSIPIFGEVIGNPCSQHAYLVFGLTLRP